MRIALCLALLACGSSSKPATTAPTESDCEPGRCLEDISNAVAPHKPAARKCAGSTAGRVIINFKIGKDGSVEEADQGMQDNQITDPAIVSCITDVVKAIKFTSSTKTTRAYHQFEFSGQ